MLKLIKKEENMYITLKIHSPKYMFLRFMPIETWSYLFWLFALLSKIMLKNMKQ